MTPGMGVAPATDLSRLPEMFSAGAERSFPYFNLVGPDREKALQLDNKVRDLMVNRRVPEPDTEEYKRLLQAFIASPLTGCTTVLDQLRAKAKYDPLHPQQNTFMQFFFLEIPNHPLFAGTPVQDSFGFSDGPGPKLDVKQMVDRLKGSDATAAKMIEDQLRATLSLAIKTVGAAQSTELVNEHSLSVDGTIRFSYLRSRATVSVTVMPPMSYWFTLDCSKGWLQYEFHQPLWPQHADAVLREHLKTAEDWLKPLSTVTN